jgi:transcription factor, RsfA family
MTKVRQDAWSHEDDLLLAETVLRHIREGSTQLDAFEEVGDRLNRTGAACGFRWNAIVRRKYEQAIEIAKKQRKQKKRAERQTRPVRPVLMPAVPAMEISRMEEPDEPHQDAVPTTVLSGNSLPDKKTGTFSFGIPEIISFLKKLGNGTESSGRLSQENSHLKSENSALLQKIDALEKEIASLQERQQTVEDDYQALMGIMDRARRMVAFQDQSAEQGATFKMDQNGNLEKVAK